MRASPETSLLSSQEQKVIPASHIIALIEKALQSQTPPKNPALLKIFETWKNDEEITDRVDSNNKNKIIALIESTFEATHSLIKEKEAQSAVTSQRQFDLSALEVGSVFYEDMQQKVTASNDPNGIDQVIKLMLKYLCYIDNLSNLSDEQRHGALSQFPPQDKTFYGCIGGIEGRLLNTRLGLNLSGIERFLYKIHNDIVEECLPRFISHVASNFEAHTPFTLLQILGVNQDIIKAIDEDAESLISNIPIADAVEFLSTYETRFNEAIDSLIATIRSYVGKNDTHGLSELLKPYGIDINPLSHEIHPTQFFRFNENYETEWLQNNIERFAQGLQDLKTADPALPLITINQSKERAEQLKEIMLQLLDPELPKKLAQDILSGDPRRQTKAINVLYFLGETFVGSSSYQLLQFVKLIGYPDLTELKALKENTNFSSATNQKLEALIYNSLNTIQQSLDGDNRNDSNSFSVLLASNMPLIALQDKLTEHAGLLTLGIDKTNAAATLATNPNRQEILQLLQSKLSSQDCETLLQEMWRYAAKNRYPDFIKDLCELSKNNSAIILSFLQEKDDYGLSVIANIIKESPEGFLHIMPILQKLKDDEKDLLEATVNSTFEWNNGDFDLTLLHIACDKKRTEILKDLLSLNTAERKFFDLEKRTHDGFTVLELAVKSGHTEMTEKLLEAGVEVDMQNAQGNSALHVAAQKGYIEIVRALLERGAKADPENRQKVTPLHFAAGKGHAEIVKLLLKSGANIEAQNDDSYTPLHGAVFSSDVGVVKALLEKNADVAVKTHNGVTALIHATTKGYTDIVTILLENGADPSKEISSESEMRRTPTSLAKTTEIKDLLEKYQNARETIFQSADDEYFNALIATINSFTESDLFTAKTFNCNGNEIQLNAFGILNLYRDFKTSQSIADQGQSARPSTSTHLRGGKAVSLETAIAGLKKKAGIEDVPYDRKRRRSSESLMERGEATKART